MTVEKTLNDAVGAYKTEVEIAMMEDYSKTFDDEGVVLAFAEAEQAFKDLSDKKVFEKIDTERPQDASKNHYRIFTTNLENGEKYCFLSLQTKQKLEVGQRLYFGEELLKLDKDFDVLNESKMSLDWIVSDIRMCFDIEKFPNIRGADDFIGAEVLVKPAESQ